MEKHFNKEAKDITLRDLLSLRNKPLVKNTDLKQEQIQKIKLESLGVKFETGHAPVENGTE